MRSAGGIFFGSLNGNTDTESCYSWPVTILNSTPSYTTPSSGTAPPPLSLNNPFAGANAAAPTYLNCAPAGRKLPSSYQWNFVVERILDSSASLSVSYVGNTARHLDDRNLSRYNIPEPSGVVLAPGQTQKLAYPAFSTVQQYESQDTSSYNAIQAKLERRLNHGLYLSAAYTYSKALTNLTWETDPRNARLDKGPRADDLRDVFVVSRIYELPIRGKVIGGWRISSIVGYHTGFPFTPTLTGVDLLHLNGYNVQNRPDRVCNGALSHPTVNEWFDPSCFVVPVEPTTPGALLRGGTSGYNILRGPHAFTMDLGISKSFKLTERIALDCRTEMFNTLNHPVLGLPKSAIPAVATATTVTNITNLATGAVPRVIQFAMKIHF